MKILGLFLQGKPMIFRVLYCCFQIKVILLVQ